MVRQLEHKSSAANYFALFGRGGKNMSRLGRTAVIIPKGVEVKISGKMIQVKGPK